MHLTYIRIILVASSSQINNVVSKQKIILNLEEEIEPRAKERKLSAEQEKLFSHDLIVSLKKELKSVLNSRDSIEKAFTIERKLQQILQKQNEVRQQQMEEFEEYKQKVKKKLQEKLNHIEGNYNNYIKPVEKIKEDIETFINKKEKELDEELKELLKS